MATTFIAPIDIQKGDIACVSTPGVWIFAIERDGKEIWAKGKIGTGVPAMIGSEAKSTVNMTDKHDEVTRKLYNTLNKFHEDNPDLFVSSIKIEHAEYATRRKELIGLIVTIEVQPCTK